MNKRLAREVVPLAEDSGPESDKPVPCPWVNRRFWRVEEAEVEVAVIVPARRLPMEEVDSVA